MISQRHGAMECLCFFCVMRPILQKHKKLSWWVRSRGKNYTSLITLLLQKETNHKNGSYIPQLLHQPSIPPCCRRASLYHSSMFFFCKDTLLECRCDLIHYWFISFNGRFYQNIQVPLGQFILDVLQFFLEFSILRLKAFVLPVEVLKLFMEMRGSSC
jgi:hypothetical protein